MLKNKLSILIVVLLFLPWFLPGSRVATDFPLASKRGLLAGANLPQTWTSRFGNGLGEYSVGTMWAWPLDVAFGVGTQLGIGFGGLERGLGLLPALALGFAGLYLLAGPIGGLVYLANSYFLLLVDGGQLGLALAYGLLPICVYLYFHTLEQRKFSAILKLILAVVLLSIADLRIVYFLLLVICANFLIWAWRDKKLDLLTHIKIAVLCGVFLLGFHSYWILPAILSRAPSLPAAYTAAAGVDFLSFATLTHTLLLAQPHWPQNIFGHLASAPAAFVVLPGLAFIGFFLSQKNHKLAFWGLVGLGAVFLAKGNNPPLGWVYTWLFTHVPGFSLFRDPVKFYFLIALSYAILIGNVIHKHNLKTKYFGPLLALYLIVLASPIYLHKMTGTFSLPRFAADYAQLNAYLETDHSFGRVLWVPSKPPLGFSGPDHPTVEGLQLAKYRPFIVGTFGTYETMSFLRDATASAGLLQIAGIKYVVYPPLDPVRDSQKPEDQKYYRDFLQQLGITNWADHTEHFGQVPLISTNRPVSLFFIPANTQFVVGTDAIYSAAADLTQTGFVFAEDHPNLLSKIESFPSASVTLYAKTTTDAAAALLPTANLIFPAQILPMSPDVTGWWKRDSHDFLWLRSFFQEKYGIDNQDFDYHGGWAMAEGPLQLDIPLKAVPQNSVLLARVLHSSSGGKVSFIQGENVVGELDTLVPDRNKSVITVKGLDEVPDRIMQYSASEFQWSEVGPLSELSKSADLRIQTQGDLNVVNSLAIVPEDEWNALKKKAKFLLDRQPAGNLNAQVSFQQLSATHYKISVKNLTSPGMLIFSQNYDSLWRLDGQEPVLVYSFLNGFPISRNGDYDLVFSPQRYVVPGLVIAALTFGLYLGLVVYTKLCTKNS